LLVLRRRVLTPQPKLRRQGGSQDELVAYKAHVQALQLNAFAAVRQDATGTKRT